MALLRYVEARLASLALALAIVAGACGGTSSLDFPGLPSGADGEISPTSLSCVREGELACGGACTPLASDPANCGACAVACAGATPFCNLGVCASSCTATLTACQNGCVDLTSDVHDCGACGATCAASQQCTGSQCACPSGSLACSGACVDVMTDAANCGACGVQCKDKTPFCNQGTCATSCASGLTACNRACVNTLTNTAFCGACDRRCTGGQTCSAGACACPLGQVLCNGACVDSSKCRSCAAMLTSCTGDCVDTRTNSAHCGGCGLACAIGLQCKGGRCLP